MTCRQSTYCRPLVRLAREVDLTLADDPADAAVATLAAMGWAVDPDADMELDIMQTSGGHVRRAFVRAGVRWSLPPVCWVCVTSPDTPSDDMPDGLDPQGV